MKHNIAVQVIGTVLVCVTVWLGLSALFAYSTNTSYGLVAMWLLAGVINVSCIVGCVSLAIHNIRYEMPYLRIEAEYSSAPPTNGTWTWIILFNLLSYFPIWIGIAVGLNNKCDELNNMPCKDLFIENPEAMAISLLVFGPLAAMAVGPITLLLIRIFLSLFDHCHREYDLTAEDMRNSAPFTV